MCQPGANHRTFGCSCCCGCGCGTFFRRFISAKEQEERLEAYKEQLEKELAGAKERIQELKAK